MSVMILLSSVALSLIAGSSLAAQPANPMLALAPAGPWKTTDEGPRCVLEQFFGSDTPMAALQFERWPIGTSDRMTIVFRSGALIPANPQVALLFDDSESIQLRSSIAGMRDIGVTAIELENVPDKVLDRLAAARSVSLLLDNKPVTTLSLTGVAAAVSEARACGDAVYRRLGGDPILLASLKAQPVKNVAQWIGSGDYPAAEKKGISGATVLAYRLGANGKLSDCRVLFSSGSAILDSAGCATFERNATFQPALQADGTKVDVMWTTRINWRIAGTGEISVAFAAPLVAAARAASAK